MSDSIADKLWKLPTAPVRKPRRKKPLERAIQDDIAKALNLLGGVHVERQMVGGARIKGRFIRFGQPGQGDLVGTLQLGPLGVHLEVEVKRPGEKQSPAQLERQAQLARTGACYVLAHSATEAVDAVRAWKARAADAARAFFSPRNAGVAP